MGGDSNEVTLITADGAQGWPKMTKTELAGRLAERIAKEFAKEFA
jgi:phosphopantothenoylcysteine decarboxylase/phosphopantothenate--cysteine ligase